MWVINFIKHSAELAELFVELLKGTLFKRAVRSGGTSPLRPATIPL